MTTGSVIDNLSARRREILELIAKGLTNSEIASVLNIKTGTVRTHVATLLQQLDVTNRTEAAALFTNHIAHPAQVARVIARPAIAVLPFENLGDTAAAIARGLTVDFTNLFARWCWFPVISAASARMREAGEDDPRFLRAPGARYVVRGGVRSRAGTLRLNVQIDDVESGYCLWTDTQDVPASSFFDVQDDLCNQIVAKAYPLLIAKVAAQPGRRSPPENLAAWELAHAGMALQSRRARDSNTLAMVRFADALAKDPTLVLAHFGRGLAAYDAVLNQWGDSKVALRDLAEAADACTRFAPHGAEGDFLLARYHQARAEHARAIEPLQTAIGRNPSFATAHALLALVLQLEGRGEEALSRMNHAVRLGPRAFVAGLASLHFVRGDYKQALDAAQQAIATNPRYAYAHLLATASAWWLDETARAHAHLRALQDQTGRFDTRSFVQRFGPDVDAVQRIEKALHALAPANEDAPGLARRQWVTSLAPTCSVSG